MKGGKSWRTLITYGLEDEEPRNVTGAISVNILELTFAAPKLCDDRFGLGTVIAALGSGRQEAPGLPHVHVTRATRSHAQRGPTSRNRLCACARVRMQTSTCCRAPEREGGVGARRCEACQPGHPSPPVPLSASSPRRLRTVSAPSLRGIFPGAPRVSAGKAACQSNRTSLPIIHRIS